MTDCRGGCGEKDFKSCCTYVGISSPGCGHSDRTPETQYDQFTDGENYKVIKI